MAVATDLPASPVFSRFNPFDPELRRDPYPFYVEARAEGRLLRHPLVPILNAFRYEDVAAILKDDHRFSSHFEPATEALMTPEARERFRARRRDDLPPMMIFTDGDEHQRLRSLVNQAFTPRMVGQLRPRIEQIADDLLDECLADGVIEAVDRFAHPLPLIVIAEMIGVPSSDRDRFKSWSNALTSASGSGFGEPPSDEVMDAQLAVIDEMREYFSALAEDRRAAPRDDLLSGLVAAELEGSRLSMDEMLQMLILLLVAGNETTRNLIGNSIFTLLTHPDQLSLLRDNATLLPTAIDEVLRFASPFQLMVRRVAASVDYEGLALEKDTMILTWLGSANRDPSVFESPEIFDVRRDPNRHLAMSIGRHFCLGANLAKLEGQIAIGRLLARTRKIALATSDPLPMNPNFAFNGFTEIPIELEAV
jgi:cytochrome P450